MDRTGAMADSCCMPVLTTTVRWWALAGLLGLCSPWGCSPTPEGEGTLVVGWTFVDGRRCAESGVERVAVLSLPDEENPLLLSTCAKGYGAPALEVELPAGDHTLRVDGLSAASSVLYRVTREVTVEDGERLELKASLVFIGGT